MAKIKNLEALLKAMKFDSDTIQKVMADNDEELELNLPEGHIVYTKEEWEPADKSKKGARANLEDVGIDKGRDFYAKDLKDKYGITKAGKNVDTVGELLKESFMAEAGKTPAEWEGEKKRMQEALTEKDNTINDLTTRANRADRNSKILSNLPERNGALSDDEYLMIIGNKLETKIEAGKEVHYWDGQKLESDKFDPLPLKDALTKVWETKPGWAKPKADNGDDFKGDGFGDTGGGKTGFKNMDEFTAHLQKKGIEMGSEAGNKELQQALAKNPSMAG